MATKTAAVSVTTTATKLNTQEDADSRSDQYITVYNNGAATVYVGGADVTTSNGIPVAAGASIDGALLSGSDLYGRVASGTCECRVMQIGV